MKTGGDHVIEAALIDAGRSPANLERRSQLRRLDDLLEALETLNLGDSRVLSAGLAERLDELGIYVDPDGAPVTGLIEQVLEAQEPFMIHAAPEGRRKLERVTFDPSRLRL
jgi:hypothetical protein